MNVLLLIFLFLGLQTSISLYQKEFFWARIIGLTFFEPRVQRGVFYNNQRKVVDAFLEKVDTHNELLMYAVMRFGKSFTALSCAAAKHYKKILVVSAKADVATEWQKTVEMPECFHSYRFLRDRDLQRNPNAIADTLAGNEELPEAFQNKDGVVVFLTLQNLSGKTTGEDGQTQNIKKKLEPTFRTEFDMIIIDETHYGAWAEVYGKSLKSTEEDEDVIQADQKEFKRFTQAREKLNEEGKLKAKVKLHLSGTPYNLLYEEKFNESNIIATCQFSDILKDKAAWYELHKEDIVRGTINPATGCPYEEYDNPYFGFPNMLRFAFALPKATEERLIAAKGEGKKWTLNDFLETNKDAEHPSFLYEEDVLRLLKVIDGTEADERILSFLDVDTIKDNDVCKHIVMVLPYKYSCDAMEKLLRDHREEFKHLCDYTVLNITGHNLKAELDSVEKVKRKIKEVEANADEKRRKSITLTVNKMLTGVTVPEWDTMIMLKNTKSPQEYDQAIFRIQSQYVKEYEEIHTTDTLTLDRDAPRRTIKKDMKPQTILVDFDPVRMFELQGLSTKIVNSISTKCEDLNTAIRTELHFSPIIAYNADQLIKVTPTDIVELIVHYNKNLSIMDASDKVKFDDGLKEVSEILSYIQSQDAKGLRSNLSGRFHEGEEPTEETDFTLFGDERTEEVEEERDRTGQTGATSPDLTPQEQKQLLEKYKKCIARLMFYAFLTKTDVNSLKEVYASVFSANPHQENNARIFKNLDLDEGFIKNHLIYCKKLYAKDIDDVISQANLLSKDDELSNTERVKNALARFSKISESEIVTPQTTCKEMLNLLGVDALKNVVQSGGRILDIAGKTGEFAFALYEALENQVDAAKLQNAVYTIPTSPVTYEFTRYVYEILGLNVDNIANPQELNSYALLTIKKRNKQGKETTVDYDTISALLTQGQKKFSSITPNDIIEEGAEQVKFDVIVGNPPYQKVLSKKYTQTVSQANPIYHLFVELSIKLNPRFISLITPSLWLTGGTGLDSFRKYMLTENHISIMHDYESSESVFNNVNIAGGISYFLWDKRVKGRTNYHYHRKNGTREDFIVDMSVHGTEYFIRDPKANSILEKIGQKREDFSSFMEIVSTISPFSKGATGTFDDYFEATPKENSVKIYRYAKVRSDRYAYIDRARILYQTEWIDKHKVFVSKAGEVSAKFNGLPFYGEPGTVCSETYLLVGPFDDRAQCENAIKYMNTNLYKYLIAQIKKTQNAARGVYKFVPMQDFTENADIDWTQPLSQIDAQLYDKYGITPDERDFIDAAVHPIE